MTRTGPARAALLRLLPVALAVPALGGCDLLLAPPPDDQGEEEALYDVTMPEVWPLVDVYDGQTHVPLEALRVRGVHWDALGGDTTHLLEAQARSWFALLRAADQRPHPFSVDVDWLEAGSVTVRPSGGLDPDTDYLLAVPDCELGLQPHVRCPPPLHFSTRSAPRPVSFWRVSDTLLIVFSEPMDPATLQLGHGAVDLVFEDEGVSYTVASDMNLADFMWSTEGRVFSVAPVSDLPVHVLLGPDVRGASGEPLDVDGDRQPDPGETFVHPLYPTLLPLCWTRADYPAPCVREDEAETIMQSYGAPLEVALDLP